MFRSAILFVVLFLASCALSGQEAQAGSGDNAAYMTESFTGLQASIRELSIMHERQLGDSPFALRLDAGVTMDWPAGFGLATLGNAIDFSQVYLGVEGRYYYNLAKRVGRGKDVRANAGSYLMLRSRYVSGYDEIIDEVVYRQGRSLTFSPRWGMRVPLKGQFDFEFNIGAEIGVVDQFNANGVDFASSMVLEWKFGYRF